MAKRNTEPKNNNKKTNKNKTLIPKQCNEVDNENLGVKKKTLKIKNR